MASGWITIFCLCAMFGIMYFPNEPPSPPAAGIAYCILPSRKELPATLTRKTGSSCTYKRWDSWERILRAWTWAACVGLVMSVVLGDYQAFTIESFTHHKVASHTQSWNPRNLVDCQVRPFSKRWIRIVIRINQIETPIFNCLYFYQLFSLF